MPRGGRTRLAFVAAGGALLALALPPAGLWAFGWFCLAPLAFMVAEGGLGAAAIAGFVAGFAYHAVALHWIYQTARFAALPVPIAVLAWVALAAALAAQWALIAVAARILDRGISPRIRPLIWAATWTAVASVFERWTPRLAVDLLGYTQGPNLALLQAASWGGPHLLDFVLVLVNAALAESWREARDGGEIKSSGTTATALALAGLVWAHGALVVAQRPLEIGASAGVELLQPNIDPYQKWNASARDENMAAIDALLALPRARTPVLVIWPETAIPTWTRPSLPAAEGARWAKELRAEQLVGVLGLGAHGPSNAIQAISADGTAVGFYEKRELVPFGEYIPFASVVPHFVERLLPIIRQLGGISAGQRNQPLLRTPLGAVAATICYEAMFPRWSRYDAARGARLIVNATNDGWYGDTWGPIQHLAANRIRAIETRDTVLRAANTGISAMIDPWGVVVASLPLATRGRLDVDVPLGDPFPDRSIYVRWGDWVGNLSLAAVGFLALFRARPTR